MAICDKTARVFHVKLVQFSSNEPTEPGFDAVLLGHQKGEEEDR